MSKKTHHMAELKEQEKASRSEHLSLMPKKTGAKKKQANASGSAGRGAARVYDRSAAVTATMSVTYLRIVGVLMAVIGLGGGIYWSAQVGQNFTPGVIVGLIALGLLGGLGAFTAFRAKDLAARARAAKKR